MAALLAVAAVALLSPLQRQLQDDELRSMARAVRAERGALARLTARDDLTATSLPLRAIARTLRRTTGAEVSVYGENGRVVFDTDPEPGAVFPEVGKALRTGTEQRVTASNEDQVRVAVPLKVDDTRIAIDLRKPLAGARNATRVVRTAFAIAAAISLLAALLLGLLLSARLVRRLRALRDTALRVAQMGPVAEMQGDDARDEVGDLTRALVTMQEHLREQEQARRTFVATASHELRTPLTSLTVMLDMLRGDLEADTLDLDDARRQAERAEAQADRLSQLAAQLLDLSRIDAGVPLRAELVEAGEIVRSVVAEFDVRLRAVDQMLTVAADGAQWAVADPGSVARIVRVLLDNALCHGRSDTPIRVTVEQRDGRALVTVVDRGPGVPPGEAERIFERFERGENSGAAPGFGLGLAIARELARRMDGDLTVTQASPGPGACFVLTMPAAPGPAVA